MDSFKYYSVIYFHNNFIFFKKKSFSPIKDVWCIQANVINMIIADINIKDGMDEAFANSLFLKFQTAAASS